MAVPPPDLKLDLKAFMKQLEEDSIPDPKYSIMDFAGVEQRTLKWSTDKFKWPDTYTVSISKPCRTTAVFQKQLEGAFNFDDIDLTPSQAQLDHRKMVDDLLEKRLHHAMLYGSQQFRVNHHFTWDDNPCHEVTLNEALKKKNRLDEVKAVKAICDLLAKVLT